MSSPLDPYIDPAGPFHDPLSASEGKLILPADMRAFATASRDADAAIADRNYVHTQTEPATVWTITHNLNKFPAVDVVDSGGSVVIPDVMYNSTTTVTLTFGSATSGKAYVN